ncbi:MAG: sulfotransferase [Planctomycetota bacterium]|nr:sulfotransferase [Planctomycetota bacterium]
MTSRENHTTVIHKVNDLIRQKYFGLARELIARSLKEHPNSIALRVKLVEAYQELRDFHQAVAILEPLLKELPDNDHLFSLLPQALLATGRPVEAVERAKELRERIGLDNPIGIGQLAEIYEKTSQTENLRALTEEIKPNEETTKIIKLLSQGRLAIRDKEYEHAIDFFLELKKLLENTTTSEEHARITRLVDCCFQLAKVYDRIGEYDLAWFSASQAHQLQVENGPKFDADQYKLQLEAVAKRMDRATLSSLARCETNLEYTPLYIVGNPRSGTSLLEQILSMHPKVANGGELSVGQRLQEDMATLTDSYHGWPDSVLDLRVDDANKLGKRYMQSMMELNLRKPIVSNKALNLQIQIGFLSLITPNCKAVMLYRYPLDNCVSCFTTNLLSSGHLYCCDLQDMGRVWLARRKIMEHWQETLEIPVLELHYESMVQQQEFETRRILEFLELEWDESCLNFHQSDLVARTISYDQVNRKMYNTSNGRWKNYEKHLQPFAEIVGDYL